MAIVTPGFHLVDVRNEELLTYNANGVAKLHETADATLGFMRLMPGKGIAPYATDENEEDALVLGGTLTYPVGIGQELTAPAGRWLVARPGDQHGYSNRTERPVSLLLFRVRATTQLGMSSTRIYLRVFQPLGDPKPRLTVYDTEYSRGELIALRPGERTPANRVRYAAAYCLSGRIMCLMGRERLALEAGEGVCLVHTAGELVGASGMSTVALYTTLF